MLTLHQSTVLVSWSIVIGLALIIAGVVTNRFQGGQWLDFPLNYTTAGYCVYFAGWAVFLAACAVAKAREFEKGVMARIALIATEPQPQVQSLPLVARG